MIEGQLAHVTTDAVEDHTQEVWNTISPLIKSEADIYDIKRYISDFQETLKLFFIEIYEKTTAKAQELENSVL